jgi:hypothetical protein
LGRADYELITIIRLTNKVSPLDSRLVMKIVDHTVHATSGKLAASVREIPVGTGRTCPSGTATFSAYPPPARRAHTCEVTPHNISIHNHRTTHSHKAYLDWIDLSELIHKHL